ncbi:type II secretion system F family protein [Candidatus Woesearchaeota archaeon]|nr:type II secretion system F family protein [Candidatus Woesearchaeota archaeon]
MIEISRFYSFIARRFLGLDRKLKQAGMPDTKTEFIKKTFLTAGYTTLALFFVFFLFFSGMKITSKLLIILFGVPFAFLFVFFYLMKYPDVQIGKKENDVNKEIIFAGRFMIIELDSGVPLYQAMINVGKTYEVVGSYFREVIEKVNVGTTLEVAINEAVEIVPSANLRKIFWQILNSLKTGSNISASMNSVIEQIIREQQISVKEYGRKLNPLAMFYMMVAVIIPSLGMTMLVVLATFMGLQLSLTVLFSILGLLGFIQFMFVAIIRSSRPAVEI